MTISTTISRMDYVGNGATGIYSYTFRIFLEADLLVTVRNPVSGIETTLVLTTDYTVDGVTELAGGDVSLVDSGQEWMDGAGNLLIDWILVIRRVVLLKQKTDIRNQGDYFPETIEDQFDRQVQIDQQQQDELDRTVKLPETITASEFDPSLPEDPQPGQALIVNDAGDGFAWGAAGSFDIARVFKHDTMANLKTLAATTPTTPRFGYATDDRQHVYYVGNVLAPMTDDGWITLGG